MKHGLLLIALFSLSTVAASGQEPKPVCTTDYNPVEILRCGREAAKSFNPPRTADGKPDFSGYWGGSQVPHEDLHAHPRTPDDNGGPSALVDPPNGIVPIQAWAEEKRAENRKRYIDQNAQCFMSGVPRHLYMGAYQFIQTPTRLVMLSEEANAYRVIYLDDPSTALGASRPPLGSNITLWQGDSRGRWEGNTLVVVTKNQNGNPWLDQQGRFITDAATVTERFTMFEANGILYEITIDDPLVYTRPFTMALGLRKNTQPGRELFEEACYEGESNTQYLRKLGYRTYPGFTAAEARAAKDAYERRQGR
jgi:hypothetical protein